MAMKTALSVLDEETSSATGKDGRKKGINTSHSTSSNYNKKKRSPRNNTMLKNTSIKSQPNSGSTMNNYETGSKPKTKILGVICRCIFLDLPMIVIFSFFILTHILHHIHDEYLYPQFQLMIWDDNRRNTENTYYDRICTEADMTAHSVEQLMIEDYFSANDCVDHMMTHGVSIYSNILQDDVIDDLRTYVLQRNKELTESEAIPVIDNDYRWSFGIGANDDPVVTKALRQIATHQTFRPALEKIVGADPAVIEMTAITAAYGAGDQYWHADVVSAGSALKYSQSFVPSYSLFITLQDTTANMGATQVCPGTYMCINNGPDFCIEKGFPVSGTETVWKKGSGALVNQQNQHRGAAHVDPNAPHRVVFILTFAPRPVDIGETRMIGQGGSYSLRWDMWGHTLNDYADARNKMAQPWTTLRALGIYKPSGSNWGWDYVSVQTMRIANEDTGFTTDDLESFVSKGAFGLPAPLEPRLHFESSWDNYLFESMLMLKYFSGIVNLLILTLYLSVTISKISRKSTTTSGLKLSSFTAILRRLFLTHGIIIIFALVGLHRLKNSFWARSIKSGRLFRPSLMYEENEKHMTITDHTVLPDSSDILVGTRLNLKRLASYNQILNFHPGNRKWQKEITESRLATTLFRDTPKHIQDQLVEGITKKILEGKGKFLQQNKNGDWILMKEDEIKKITKQEFFLQENPLARALIGEISFLKSECRYRTKKDSIWCHTFGLAQLISLEQTILEKLNIVVDEELLVKQIADSDTLMSGKALNYLSKLAIRTKLVTDFTTKFTATPGVEFKSLLRRSSISNILRKVESSKFSEFQEGDTVEAQYLGVHNEWYRGKVLRVKNGPFYDVQYDDGDTDLALGTNSVRKFTAYEVDQVIEFLNPFTDSLWERGKVINKDKDGFLNISRFDGNIFTVSGVGIRRFDWDWEIGDEVVTLFRGRGESWYEGKVIAKNIDNTTILRSQRQFHVGSFHIRT